MSYGAIVAITAAEEKRRQDLLGREEEERMTQYTPGDLDNDWEFKIVRSEGAAFRNPNVLNKLIEEEAQAGWVMLEKLDDRRIRFKRLRSARVKDTYLPAGVDPYRTRYGASTVRYVVLALVVIGLVVLTLVVVGSFLAGGTGTGSETAEVPWIMLMSLILIVLCFFLVIWKLRRLR
jgi:hypothetical protein